MQRRMMYMGPALSAEADGVAEVEGIFDVRGHLLRNVETGEECLISLDDLDFYATRAEHVLRETPRAAGVASDPRD